MLIGISGPPGVGKTEFVNSIRLKDRVNKYTGFYIEDINSFEEMHSAIYEYENVLEDIPDSAINIMDSTPYDLYPLIGLSSMDRSVKGMLYDYLGEVVEKYEYFFPLTVILVEPKDFVFMNSNIPAELYNAYYDTSFTDRIRGEFVRVRTDNAMEYLLSYIIRQKK